MIRELRSCLRFFVERAEKQPLSPYQRQFVSKLKDYVSNGEKKLIDVLLALEAEPFDIRKHIELREAYNLVKAAPAISENEAINIASNLKFFQMGSLSRRLYNYALLDTDESKIRQVLAELITLMFDSELEEGINWKKSYLMNLQLLPEPIHMTGTFLDDVGGLLRDDFVIIGAGTGVGKTTWLLTIARNLMRLGKKVLYIDYEGQSNNSLTRLVKCIVNSENDSKIWFQNPVIFVSTAIKSFTGKEPPELLFAVWINKVLSDWRNERLKMNLPTNEDEYPDVIIIDYLQVLGNRFEFSKLEPFCRILYSFCSTRSIPLITGSQLKKDMNKLDNKIPQLKDLYGFSNYIHTASKVFLIVRPPSLTHHIRNKWRNRIPRAELRLAGFLVYTAKNRSELGANLALVVEYDYENMTILNKKLYELNSEKYDDLLNEYMTDFSDVDLMLERRGWLRDEDGDYAFENASFNDF